MKNEFSRKRGKSFSMELYFFFTFNNVIVFAILKNKTLLLMFSARKEIDSNFANITINFLYVYFSTKITKRNPISGPLE